MKGDATGREVRGGKGFSFSAGHLSPPSGETSKGATSAA